MFHLLLTSTLLSTLLLSAKMGSVDAHHLPDQPATNARRYPSLLPRDVYNPKIKNPTARTVWTTGSKVTVTWDLRDIPKEARSAQSMVILGWLEPGSTNEHLDLEHPLARGFPIGQGRVTFVVPAKVPPRDNYIVVVFGDSGNRSPTFRIESVPPRNP